MKYANDNRVVRTVYSLTTGPYRLAFYLLVVVAILAAMYFPLRDLYSAYRTNEIVEQQLSIRKKYNEKLQGEVDSLLSQDGIENAARDMGLVMPGEKAIDVTGDSGSSDGSSSSGADTSEAVSEEEDAVEKDRPWYIEFLDAVFFYQGADGQKVVSSGE